MSNRPLNGQSIVLLLGLLASGVVLTLVVCHHLVSTFAAEPENPTLVFQVQEGGNQSIGSTNSTTGVSGSTRYYAINDTLTLDAYIDCSGNNWMVEIDNNGNEQYGGNDTNQIINTTTMATLGNHTVEASAHNGTNTVGPITGTLMVADTADAKANTGQGSNLSTGTVYRGLPASGNLSIPIQAYLTNGTANTTVQTECPYSFLWNLTAANKPAGSTASVAYPDKLGTNLIGVDKLGNYTIEAKAGNSSATANVTVCLMNVNVTKATNASGSYQAGNVCRILPLEAALNVPLQAYLSDGTTIDITSEPKRPLTFSWNLTSATSGNATISSNNLSANLTGIDLAGTYVCQAKAADDSAPANVTVLAIGVKEVKWVGVARNDGGDNFDEDGNPASYGGGDRIFPGRNHPSGTAGKDDLHDRMLIRVKLSPAPPQGENITVYFRLFDPDHYSTDTSFDPNGASDEDDNVQAGEPLTINVGATLRKSDFSANATNAMLVGDGTSTNVDLGLHLNHIQPGNNWIVAAGLNQTDLNNVVFGADGTALKISGAPGAGNWPHHSSLLTVWRYLYAEIDRMDDPVFDAGPGRSKFASGAAARTAEKTVQLTLGGANTIIACQTDQFENGKVELLKADNTSLGVLDVIGSTTGGTPTLTTVQNVSADTAKFKDLEDDDITNSSAHKVDGSGDMALSTTLWQAKLAPALVLPDFDQAEVSVENSNGVAFDVHVGDDDTTPIERADIRAAVSANKGSTSEAGFWVVYQLGGFQGRMNEEGDPDAGGTECAGVSSVFSAPLNDGEAGTLVYAETIRDICEHDATITISIPDLKAVVSVHEVAHEFGLGDGAAYGSLMDGSVLFVANTPAKVNALNLSAEGLRAIMLTEQPGHDPH